MFEHVLFEDYFTFPFFFQVLSQFLVPFFSFPDQFCFPILQELEKVEDREEKAKEVYHEITNHVHLGSEVVDSFFAHDEGPRQGQRQNNVDDLSKNHVLLFLFEKFPQSIAFLKTGEEPLKEKDDCNIGKEQEHISEVDFEVVRRDVEVEGSRSIDHF